MTSVLKALFRVSLPARWPSEPPIIQEVSGGDVRTDYLVAQPSTLSGVARVLDLAAIFDDYDRSGTPDEADVRALYNDWRKVGQDLLSTGYLLYPQAWDRAVGQRDRRAGAR